MNRGIALLIAAGGLLAGCGGDNKDMTGESTNAASGGAGNPLTAPVDYVGAVGAAHKQAQQVVDTTTLQRAVQAFQAGEDRLPESLEELVSSGYMPRLPEAPPGTRFNYDPRTGRVTLGPGTPGR